MAGADRTSGTGYVELYWIPFGAGAHVVKVSGKAFEAVVASVQRRSRCDLYHAALLVTTEEGRFAVEQAPVPDGHRERRGVVAEGPVGVRWAGRFRVFRYEVRCWRDGTVPDLGAAIASPVRVADGSEAARRVLDVLPSVPTPVWGRNELRAGEMWNSNSIVAWTLSRSGIDVDAIPLPPGGRAPGWRAGVVVAARRSEESPPAA